MKKSLKFIGVILVSAVFFGIVFVGANYFNTGLKINKRIGDPNRNIGPVITVMNWNIGYGGLGKDSDFVMDGGESLQPPSREIVELNVKGISNTLQKASKTGADFYLIQEISKPDMLNWGVDVLGEIRAALSEYSSWFTYDFSTRLVPTRWALKHGLATFTPFAPDNISTIRLPNEPERLGNIIERQYHIQLTEFRQGENDWVLMNIHLSAFDAGGNIRVQQFEKLLEIAGSYYGDGKYVIIGGDWNMQLAPTDFPHTTLQKDLFWLKTLPQNSIKPGWQLVFDENVATVRTNERPYRRGQNYTTIIDGFLVSPNVAVGSVQTLDLNFEFTDHQPTIAAFTAKP